MKGIRIVLAATLMAACAAIPSEVRPQEPAVSAGDNDSASGAWGEFDKKVYRAVKDLAYSDEVASGFVAMVRSWNCDALSQTLRQAAQDAAESKISADQYAQAEEEVVKQLAQTMRKHIAQAYTNIAGNLMYFDLGHVVRDRKAQCLGWTQLVYVLGNAVGLTTRAVHVVADCRGLIPADEAHDACLVDLHNGRALQVDLTLPGAVSKPFLAAKDYDKVGNYWEINDKENHPNLHPRIQPLDRNGLVAALYVNWGTAFEGAQPQKALVKFTKAIELNPAYAEAYADRGNAYNSLGQPQKGLADCVKAIELNPQFAVAYNNRGVAYERLRQAGNAIADYTKAIELNPKYATACFNRGNLYGGLGKPREALVDLTKAIELDPNYAKAYGSRGNAYDTIGQRGKAIADYTKAIELSPNGPEAYFNRGLTYGSMGNTDEAVSDYSKAIELNPRHAKAYANRGLVYAKLGRMEDAERDLRKAIELNPRLGESLRKKAAKFNLEL
jgi:tetratricopeptide (TPR) repeat protein